MSGDALLLWNPALGIANLELANGDITTDDGLETAVIISLFTDRRALDGDPLSSPGDDPRGWWGDMFPDVEGDFIGSRLWLLAREKNLPGITVRAEEIAREALQWMLDDRVAQSVSVVATQPRVGWLVIEIAIARPGKQRATYKYDLNWAAQEVRRIA